MRTFYGPEGGAFRDFFVLNPVWHSNRLCQLLFTYLFPFFSPAVCEKMVVTLYFFLFGISFRFLLQTLRRRAVFLVLPGLVMAPNFFLSMGFYNFALALSGMFVALALGWRGRRHMSALQILGLSLLLILTYFAHAIPAAAAMMALALLHTARAIAAGKSGRKPWAWPAAFTACLPCLFLLVMFVREQLSAGLHEVPRPAASLARLKAFLDFSFLVSFDQAEALPAALLPLLLAVLFLTSIRSDHFRKTLRLRAGWLAMPVCLLTLLMVFPSAFAGVGYMAHRLGYLAALFLFPVLALGRYPRRLRYGAAGLGTLLTVLITLVHTMNSAAINQEYERRDFCNPAVPEARSLLTIPFDTQGQKNRRSPLALRFQPFRHHGERVAARKHLASLSNFSASTLHHPIRFRPGKEPYGSLVDDPRSRRPLMPQYHILDYEKNAKTAVDLVLLTGLSPELMLRPENTPVLAELKKNYTAVCVSPDESVQLYLKKS